MTGAVLTAIIFSATYEASKIIGGDMERATKILYVGAAAEEKLAEFGITRSGALRVVQHVVAARADEVDDDPLGTAGQFAHIFGTRHVRGLFKPAGWVKHREENVETVLHEATRRRVVYKSVDVAGRIGHSPKSVRDIGPGARRLVDAAQGSLFSDEDLPEQVRAPEGEQPTLWYFCVSVEENEAGERIVGAELSLPYPFKGDNFAGFLEQIIIRENGPWGGLVLVDPAEDAGDAVEFEPTVSRKA